MKGRDSAMHRNYKYQTKTFSRITRFILSFAIASALLLPCLLFPVSALVYTDVPTTHWAYTYIDQVTDRGVMEAYTGNYFRPAYAITRVSAVSCLGKLADVSPYYGGSSPFTDMPSGTEGLGYVLWAKDNNIISGTSETTFSPNQAITKESFAVLIYNFLVAYNHSYTRSSVSNFNDQSQISSWAQEAVSALHSNGLISGDGSNNFNPQNTITRAEAAVVFSRIPDCGILANGIYTIKNASTAQYMNVYNTASGRNGLNTTANNYIITTPKDNSYGAQYFRFTQDLATGYYYITPLCSYYGFHRQIGATSYGVGASVMTALPTDTSYYMKFKAVQVGVQKYQFLLASNVNVALADVNGQLKLKAQRQSDTTQQWTVYSQSDLVRSETEYRSLKWQSPIDNPSNYNLTSSFGYRYVPHIHPNKPYQLHSGVDLYVPSGTEIRAVADGTVSIGQNSELGNYIRLTPTESSMYPAAAVYQHLSSISVAQNASVTKGQIIGLTGSSGVGTGAHLHFGIITDGGSAERDGSFEYFTYPNAFYNRYIWNLNSNS